MAKFFVPLVAPPPMNNGGGGGSDLPAVSAADNGDVLTVVNGAWDKAAPGGGGGGSSVLVVNTSEGTCDKTAAEMYSAVLNGIVYIKEDNVYYLVNSAENEDDAYNFGVINANGIPVRYSADSPTDYPYSED